jgi:hypothetical protein
MAACAFGPAARGYRLGACLDLACAYLDVRHCGRHGSGEGVCLTMGANMLARSLPVRWWWAVVGELCGFKMRGCADVVAGTVTFGRAMAWLPDSLPGKGVDVAVGPGLPGFQLRLEVRAVTSRSMSSSWL